MAYLYVGIGGFIGSILRYLVGIVLYNGQNSFPFVTLFVNLFGSFLLAYVTFRIFEKFTLSNRVKVAVTTGVLGSFTTFSALSVETITLLENGLILLTLIYVSLSLIGGLFMAYLGYLCKGKVVHK